MTTQESNDVRLLKSVQEIWASTQEVLAKKMKKPTYHTWIQPLQLLEIKDGEAIVGVANDFMRSMVTSSHIASIGEALTHGALPGNGRDRGRQCACGRGGRPTVDAPGCRARSTGRPTRATSQQRSSRKE